LNSSLLAQIFPVKLQFRDGKRLFISDDVAPTVQFPITDASIEQSVNWHSPFENQSPDAALGSIAAIAQSGGGLAILNALEKQVTGIRGADSFESRMARETVRTADSLVGKSGITKLNSTQTLAGVPPMKLTMTCHFRALKNARSEVQAPIDQLMQWLLPEELAADGAIVNLLNGEGLSRSLFPSKTPTLVAFGYSGRRWSPMVIESISMPMTVPRTKDGDPVHSTVSMQIASLSAIDRAGWQGIMGGSGQG
jgi:hypothetical protein